jgi:hypothetical protein
MVCRVYKATCTENGRYYIGIEIVGDRDWRKKLANAQNSCDWGADMLKYGRRVFVYENLHENVTKEDANVWVWKYVMEGLNLNGGDGLIYNTKVTRMKSVNKALFEQEDIQKLIKEFGLRSLIL